MGGLAPDEAEDLLLTVSEVVSVAVEHGATAIDLTVRRDDDVVTVDVEADGAPVVWNGQVGHVEGVGDIPPLGVVASVCDGLAVRHGNGRSSVHAVRAVGGRRGRCVLGAAPPEDAVSPHPAPG
jgi:hypothetical protein